MALTTREVESIKPGQWLSADSARGGGRLAVFGMKAGGASFYFRYTRSDGGRDMLPLGFFDPKGKRGLTLQQATERAGQLSLRYRSGDKDLRAALEAEERQKAAAAEDAKREAAALAARGTLGTLLEAYADALEAAGRPSAIKVRASLKLHVAGAHPDLWTKHAQDFTTDDAVTIVSTLLHAGSVREADKVRSYLRAAFARAVIARLDPAASTQLRRLGITQNPVAAMVMVAPAAAAADSGDGTRARNLSLPELRAYWSAISTLPDPDGALLRLHLLSGGQRVQQLSRVTAADVDLEANTLTMWDRKGRRRKPRQHVVPLLPGALAAINALRTSEPLGPHVFTVDRGLTAAGYHILQVRVASVAAAMVKAGTAESLFTPGDVRRTVETRLSASKVSKADRAQLQSHGLSGVQDKHYDRHDYLDEKRAALETLLRLLEGKPADVVPLKRGAG